MNFEARLSELSERAEVECNICVSTAIPTQQNRSRLHVIYRTGLHLGPESRTFGTGDPDKLSIVRTWQTCGSEMWLSLLLVLAGTTIRPCAHDFGEFEGICTGALNFSRVIFCVMISAALNAFKLKILTQ